MLIIDLQYFANTTYYSIVLNNTDVILEQYENFRKMSFHNRCTLSGANGALNLSIPVEGGRTQRNVFKDVRISKSENWQRAHWRGIISGYNKSPWFEHYRDELAVLYTTDFEWLIDWNRACFDWSLRCLKVELEIRYSDSYIKDYGDKMTDWRGKINPGNPDPRAGATEESMIIYPQVFEDRNGFIPHLSILDLLFCEGGKRAYTLLTKA